MAFYSLKKHLPTLLVAALILAGCDQPPAPQTTSTEQSEAAVATTTGEKETAPVPPRAPLVETFQAQPQISLFPRVSGDRPEKEDELYPFWTTYLDHLRRTSGVIGPKDGQEGNRFFALRSIDTIDSVGFFSPIEVDPATTYRISARIKAELPGGGSCGIGLIEFNQFLWIGDQFTEAQNREHQLSARPGISLTGTFDWQEQSVALTTGPKTRMIHLVLFRDGPDGKLPVLFDDLKIEAVEK